MATIKKILAFGFIVISLTGMHSVHAVQYVRVADIELQQEQAAQPEQRRLFRWLQQNYRLLWRNIPRASRIAFVVSFFSMLVGAGLFSKVESTIDDAGAGDCESELVASLLLYGGMGAAGVALFWELHLILLHIRNPDLEM